MPTRKSIIRDLDYLRNLQYFIEEDPQDKIIYLDTSEVIDMIKGSESLYRGLNRTRFDRELFDSQHFFALCLIANNQTQIKASILPPHQYEINLALDKELGIGYLEPHTSVQLNNLILQSGVYRETNRQISSIDELNKFIKQEAIAGIPSYKIAISTRFFNWKSRLNYLFSEGETIIPWNTKLQYGELLNSGQYKYLFKSACEIRPEDRFIQSNKNDALALVILLSQIQAHREDLHARPIFFDARGILRKIVCNANLEAEFTINDHSVFRSSSYLIIASMFNDSQSSIRTDFSPQHIQTIEDIRKIFGELREQGSIAELIDLNQRIENYVQYHFLHNVMIDFYKEQTYSDVFEHLKIQTALLGQAKFREELEIKIGGIKENLLRGINDFDLATRILKVIELSTQGIYSRVKPDKELTRPFDAHRDLGLFRFSFPDEVDHALQKTFGSEGLFSKDENRVHNAIFELLQKTLQGQQNDNFHSHDYMYSMASLWVLGCFEEIISLEVRSERTDYSMDVLLASALLKTGDKNLERAKEIVDSLEQRISEEEFRSSLEIGVAFLHYHIWEADIGEYFTRHNELPQKQDVRCERAITLARDCYNRLSSEDYKREHKNELNATYDILKIYSLNILLHITIESGISPHFQSVATLFEEFKDIKTSKPKYWHYRYEDTIARFFHRMAYESPAKNNAFMIRAFRHIEIARQNPINDKDVENYYERLLMIE